MKIFFTKLREDARLPVKDVGDAGYDIYPCFNEDFIIIDPHSTQVIETGIASIIPDNYYVQIEERSSTGFKGMKISGGVIDPNYRGQWFISVTNTSNVPIVISKKSYEDTHIRDYGRNFVHHPYEKAIAQGVIHCIHDEIEYTEISYDDFVLYNSQNPTRRGSGRFGSTGR